MIFTLIFEDWHPYNFVSRHNYLSLFRIECENIHPWDTRNSLQHFYGAFYTWHRSQVEDNVIPAPGEHLGDTSASHNQPDVLES